MIIALATTVRSQVADYKRRQINAAQVDTIKSSRTDLENINRLAARWATAFPGVEPYLDPGVSASAQVEAARLYRRLCESKEQFGGERNQHANLARVQSGLQRLVENTEQAWQSYAAAQLKPIEDRAHFARLLPHMGDQLPTITQTMQAARQLASRLPACAADVSAFHARLEQLGDLLHRLEGMNAQQTAFLGKLGSGAATLADLSPELLAWCQAEELAALIKLSLSQ